MKIHHIGLWVRDLEMMKSFYEDYFGLKAGVKYINDSKGFSSYFLYDSDPYGGAIEIMYQKEIPDTDDTKHKGVQPGLAHLAFDLENPQQVRDLTEKLREAGCEVQSEARVTGDGYVESVVIDPEGNLLELVAALKNAGR